MRFACSCTFGPVNVAAAGTAVANAGMTARLRAAVAAPVSIAAFVLRLAVLAWIHRVNGCASGRVDAKGAL